MKLNTSLQHAECFFCGAKAATSSNLEHETWCKHALGHAKGKEYILEQVTGSLYR